MDRLRLFALRARDSFWFWPAVLGVAAVVVAQVLVDVDHGLQDDGVQLSFLDALSASGGRSILTTVGSAMLTVAGTSFSIVISVLATTSSTYGPRLVRNFMADRANQLVLAAFTSTFVYCIVVLRSVHTAVDADAFVPVIAVHVAVAGGLVDAAVLVFFIHHVATSVEVTTLQQRVQRELQTALAFAYPDPVPADVTTAPGDADGRSASRDVEAGTAVLAQSDGYVEWIDWDGLRDLALRRRLRIRAAAMPGRHVIRGEALAFVVDADDDVDDDFARRVRARFTLGAARTAYQDVRFALQQLVEVGVRGLASGTNDPYTAVSALDVTAAALVPVWRDRRPVTALLDDDGTARVLCDWPSREALVEMVFDGVLTYGSDHPLVLDAAERFADRLETASDPTGAAAVSRWRERLRAARR